MNVVLFMCLNTYRKRVEINVIDETIFNSIYYDDENEPKEIYLDNPTYLLEETNDYKTFNSVAELLEYTKKNNITVVSEIYYDEEY